MKVTKYVIASYFNTFRSILTSGFKLFGQKASKVWKLIKAENDLFLIHVNIDEAPYVQCKLGTISFILSLILYGTRCKNRKEWKLGDQGRKWILALNWLASIFFWGELFNALILVKLSVNLHLITMFKSLLNDNVEIRIRPSTV